MLQETTSSISSQRRLRERGDGEEQEEEDVEGMVEVKGPGEALKMEVEVGVEEEMFQKTRLGHVGFRRYEIDIDSHYYRMV